MNQIILKYEKCQANLLPHNNCTYTYNKYQMEKWSSVCFSFTGLMKINRLTT